MPIPAPGDGEGCWNALPKALWMTGVVLLKLALGMKVQVRK